MKLKDIIQKIDKSQQPSVDLSFFSEVFEDTYYLECMYKEDSKLRSYMIAHHMCTDTEVGLEAYFLDDEFVCLTKQRGRKCPKEIIGWASKDVFLKTKEYILSLRPKSKENCELLDLDMEMGEGYSVEFSGQLMDEFVWYKGELCKVNDRYYKEVISKTLNIQYKGQSVDVSMRDVKAPFLVSA